MTLPPRLFVIRRRQHHPLTHRPDFWVLYRVLPSEVRDLADQAYARLKRDPGILYISKVVVLVFAGRRHYRALAES
jgi:hypothetical protein